MSKYIKTSLIYLIIGLVAGVFYREFTKFNGVDGGTSLVYIHVHTIMLGTMFHLILASLEDKLSMSRSKGFMFFRISYNLGLLITIGVFLTRGITEVVNTNVSRALDMSLSGIAGIGHISLSAGFIVILMIIYKSSKRLEDHREI